MASSFSINGNPLVAEPMKATVAYQDLDGESERNANGVLVRQVIRRNVVKIELEFGPIKTSDVVQLLAQFNSSKFIFEYPDPLTGTHQKITAYCGDRQLGYMRTQLDGGSECLYDGLRVSVIEY